MTILDPSMSLQWIKKLGVLGIVDMRQLLLNAFPISRRVIKETYFTLS